jgi:hypothetical protein
LYIDNIRLDDVSITQKPFVLYYASNTDVCQDGVVQFTDTTENFPTSWLWEFPGGTPATSSLQNPTIKYSVPGRYDVNLIASNGLGSDSWLRENYINVIPKPTIGISANKTTICVGDSVLLTANGAADYTWYDERENIISGNDRIWVYPTQNAIYKVEGADTKGCKNTATRSIEVNLLPAKPVIVLNGSRLSASVISAVTYQWYSSSGIINGATGNSYLPTANGIYYVTVTNASGCSVRSDNFNYTITNTYSFTEGASSLLIYPNPVKGILNIEIKGNATIRLNSLQGSTIATYACKEKATIDLSSFAKGVYVIEVIGSNSIQRKILVLE